MSDPFSDVEPTGIISGSINFSEERMEEKGELDHYIGVSTSSDETAGGVGYTQSGFHPQDTRRLKVLKFYGMRVQTLKIQSIEAKFGFQ